MENILVVDDEPGIAQLCKRVLEQEGFGVFVASNAHEALDILARDSFSLVLTDLRMPGMGGDELVKKVRESYPHTETIIITGKGTIESAIETLKNGVYDYILKPFNIDELSATVRKCIEHNRLSRQEKVLREILYLYQFSQEMNAPRSEQSLLEFILKGIAAALKADAGTLFIYYQEKGKLVPMAGFGSENDGRREVTIGDGIAGWVAKDWEPVLVQGGTPNAAQFKDMISPGNVSSSLIAPLVNQGTLVGVVCIDRFTDKTNVLFSSMDLESVKLFTIHAALLLSSLRHQLALHELNKLKTEFVSNVSHELRTPLMSIGGAIELLDEYTAPFKSDEKIMTFLSVVSRNARRMHSLVNDLLDFARIDSKQLILRCEPFKLQDAITETVQDLQKRAQQKNITLSADCPGAGIEITADRGRVIQVLTNLIDNAIKFTQDNGWVRVGCREDGSDTVTISVSDSGIGIPQDKYEKIFQEFYQVDGSSARLQPGFGLGLAIVKSIVEGHGGEIRITSEEGKGTTFSVKLPRVSKSALTKQSPETM